MSRFVYAAIFALAFLAIGVQAQDATRQAGGPATVEVPEEVKIFTLKHANAEEMQRIVGDLFGRLDFRQANFARARSSRSGIRTSSDPRTNSLIVVGPQNDLAVIEALVKRLDTPTPKGHENVPVGNTLSQIHQRLSRLEREIARLRAGAGRPGRSGRDRSSGVSPPLSRTGRVAEVVGTRLHIEVRSSKGAAMKVVSVVPVGKRVKKGDLLLAVDTAPLEDAVNVQQIEVARAQAALKQGEAVLTNTVLQQETRVAKAKLQIELAQIELTEYQEGTRPLQLKVHEKDVQQRTRDLAVQRGIVKAGKADAKSLKVPEVELEIAETKLQVFQKYTVPKLIKELESAIDSAERDSKLVHRDAEGAVKAAEADLAVRRAQAGLEAQQLKRLRNDLTKCRIEAPHDGVVAAAGPIPVRNGSEVRERQVVLILIPDAEEDDSEE
jgi:hypothetical protein